MKISVLRCIALLIVIVAFVSGIPLKATIPRLNSRLQLKCPMPSSDHEHLAKHVLPLIRASRRFSRTLLNDLTSDESSSTLRQPRNVVFSPFGFLNLMAVLRQASAGLSRMEIDRLPMFQTASAPSTVDIQISILREYVLYRTKEGDREKTTNFMPFTSLIIDDQLTRNASVLSMLDKMENEHLMLNVYCSFRSKPEVCHSFVNDLIANITNGRINDFLINGDITIDTRLILLNVINFVGQWDTGFNSSLTTSQDFHLADGSVVQIPMMHNRSLYYHRVACNRSVCSSDAIPDIIMMPFRGDKQQIVFFVPNDFISLDEIQNHFATKIDEWKATTICGKVNLSLPKFQMKSNIDMQDALKKQGVVSIFNGATATFSIFSSPGLHISEMKHESVFDLDENGAKATTVAATIFTTRSSELTTEFAINQPFMFFIEDVRTQAMLFLGRIDDPR